MNRIEGIRGSATAPSRRNLKVEPLSQYKGW